MMWIEFYGEECPVDPKDIVELEMKKTYPNSGTWIDAGYAENYDWQSVVRYRVVCQVEKS